MWPWPSPSSVTPVGSLTQGFLHRVPQHLLGLPLGSAGPRTRQGQAGGPGGRGELTPSSHMWLTSRPAAWLTGDADRGMGVATVGPSGRKASRKGIVEKQRIVSHAVR